MPLVLDASVALSWLFRDELNPYARRILRQLDDDTAMVPSVWPLEVSNAIVIAERRGRLDREDVLRVRSSLAELRIAMNRLSLAQALGPVMDLARTHAISAYDAAYLDLAMREGLPLATLDDHLRTAAQEAGVPIAE